MPKINVYLPDGLADAVREAQLPVSSICQAALESAVQKVQAARDGRLYGRFTPRAQRVLEMANDIARQIPNEHVDTIHLLVGIVDESGNLALKVLESLDIEPVDLRAELDGIHAAEDCGDRRQPGLRARRDARARAHRQGGDVARPQLHRLRAHPPRCPRDRGHDGSTGAPPHGRRHAQRATRSSSARCQGSCTPRRKRLLRRRQSRRSARSSDAWTRSRSVSGIEPEARGAVRLGPRRRVDRVQDELVHVPRQCPALGALNGAVTAPLST